MLRSTASKDEYDQELNRVARANLGPTTTANRQVNGIRVGDWHFDTTLGKPIWVKSIDPAVWVDGAGTTV